MIGTKNKTKKVFFLGLLCFGIHCASLPSNPNEMLAVAQTPTSTKVYGLSQELTLFMPNFNSPQVQAKVPNEDNHTLTKRPAIVLLHSGFFGDQATREWGNQLAQHGFITIMPSYRGEKRGLDGKKSEGRIEFCSGEVDDAQSALAVLRARPDVDPNRIILMGASHGGCIALRTAIREPRIRAVVTFSAPVVAAPLINYLRSHPLHWFFFAGWLGGQLQNYVQGSPERFIERYEVRSPLFFAHKLTMPVLMIHGDSDQIVPVEQACFLASIFRMNHRIVKEHRFDQDGNEVEKVAPLCQDKDVPQIELQHFFKAPQTELWIMSGQDHAYRSIVEKRIKARVFEFLKPILEEDSTATHSSP